MLRRPRRVGHERVSKSILPPSELSTAVRVASQGANAKDLKLWRRFAEQTLFQAGNLAPKHMAFIVNGFARAEVPDGNVFRRLAERAIDKVDDFEPRDLALFLNAYARLAFRDVALFERFSMSIRQQDSEGFGEQQLSLVANAYARLEIKDAALFQHLSQWIARISLQLSPQVVATIANAYARVLIRNDAIMTTIESGVQQHLRRLEARDIANLLNAYARFEVSDKDAVDLLVRQVPPRIKDFGPVELSATANAFGKLEVTHTQAWAGIAASVEELALDFRARQLALVLHSFSKPMLGGRHNTLFMKLQEHVAANVDMADDHTMVLLFCAYARAGQASEVALSPLLRRLEHRLDTLPVQAQVNLIYALGRLGLQRTTMTSQLAHLLTPVTRTMIPQHLSNSLYAAAKLGAPPDLEAVDREALSNLVEAIQMRLARDQVELEPQHMANIMRALSAVHTASSLKVALPATLLDRLLKQVLKCESWASHAQLLASLTVDCARLDFGPPALFDLASRTARLAKESDLSFQEVADLVAAFSAVKLFDLDLFSWAIGRFQLSSSKAPVGALLDMLKALDLADRVFTSHGWDSGQGSQDAWPSEGEGLDEDGSIALLFPACPQHFQLQVLNFYELLGLELLARSERLSPEVLSEALPAFARAGLSRSAVPFNLLSHEWQQQVFAEKAVGQPVNLLRASSDRLLGALSSKLGEDGEASVGIANHDESILALLMRELDGSLQTTPSQEMQGDIFASSLADMLAQYARLLPDSSVSRSKSVPAVVLDPLIKRMGEALSQHASSLSFESSTAVLTTLCDVGVQPREAVDCLKKDAESKFPVPQAAQQEASVSAVARFCNVYLAKQLRIPEATSRSLEAFIMCIPALGPRPLRSAAFLLGGLHASGGIMDIGSMLHLLNLVLPVLLSPVHDNDNSGLASLERVSDLVHLLRALARLVCMDQSAMSELEDLHCTLNVASARLVIAFLQLGHKRSGEGATQSYREPVVLQHVQETIRVLSTVPRQSLQEACQLELLTVSLEHLASCVPQVGPQTVCGVLGTMCTMRLLQNLPGGAAQSLDNLQVSVRVQELYPEQIVSLIQRLSDLRRAKGAPHERWPHLAMILVRSLLPLDRNVLAMEAAQASRFCALALDSSYLSAADKHEVTKILIALLERYFRQPQHWTNFDQGIVLEISTLLRSEYPELLRSPQVPRSLRVALEDFRARSASGVMSLQ